MKKYLIVFLISMVPLIELRGAIPYAVGFGLPIVPSIIVSVIGNMLPVPFIFLFARRILEWGKDKKYIGKFFTWCLEKGEKGGEGRPETGREGGTGPVRRPAPVRGHSAAGHGRLDRHPRRQHPGHGLQEERPVRPSGRPPRRRDHAARVARPVRRHRLPPIRTNNRITMTLKRIILWSASLLLAANCLTGCLAGKFMTNYALKPAQHGEADIERTRAKADSLAPGVMAWYDDLHAKGIFKDITRTDPDGHKLHARRLRPRQGSRHGPGYRHRRPRLHRQPPCLHVPRAHVPRRVQL